MTDVDGIRNKCLNWYTMNRPNQPFIGSDQYMKLFGDNDNLPKPTLDIGSVACIDDGTCGVNTSKDFLIVTKAYLDTENFGDDAVVWKYQGVVLGFNEEQVPFYKNTAEFLGKDDVLIPLTSKVEHSLF